ncbi:hypothetical protein Tco_1102539 [Tanacetum coccineum]
MDAQTPRSLVCGTLSTYLLDIWVSKRKELCITFEKMKHEKVQMRSMGELHFFLDVKNAPHTNGNSKALPRMKMVEEVRMVHMYRSYDWFFDVSYSSRTDHVMQYVHVLDPSQLKSHLHVVKKRIIRHFAESKKSVRLMMEKSRCLFWSTVVDKTINGEVQLHALVDGKKIIVTESTVKRDLQLADEDGVDCLPILHL